MKTAKQFGQRALSILLAVLMLAFSLPLSVFALDHDSDYSISSSDNDDSVKLAKDAFEVEELREENVKHFRLEDGSYIAAQYDKPIHYLDENGEWQNIDNTLAERGSDISTGNARVKFAKKITGNEVLFTLHENNRKITMSLDGAIKKTVGTVINSNTATEVTKLQKMMSLENLTAKVLYEDILDGVDLEYIVDSYDIKENIIVKEKSDNYTYTFTMQLNNLNAVLDDKGQILLSDSATGVIEYIIPAPIASDANSVYAENDLLYYTLTDGGNGKYSLSVHIDSDWMNDESRVYPVTIDPPISVPKSTVTDLDINSNSPATNYSSSTTMYVGQTWRGYWKTASLPYIPASAYITQATISLYSSSTSGNYVGVYQVTTNWDSTLTWNKTTASSPQGSVSSTLLDYNCINGTSSNGKRYTWDITKLVRDWYDGDAANHGISFNIVSNTTPSSANSIFNTSETVNYPKFSISYKDIKGVESYWTFSSQNAGLAGTGSVKNVTGALTFSKALLSTTDSLMQYTPTIVYNSDIANLPNQYPNTEVSYWGSYMPYGFKININETLIQKSYTEADGSTADYYVWSDGDGTEHYFLREKETTSTYRDEDGLQLTLNVNTSTCTITDSEKTVRTFNKLSSSTTGVLSGWYLQSITDSNNNKILFSFESGPRPNGVSLVPNNSTQIDYLTISYNSSYLPYIIWNQTTKEAIIFRYSDTPTGEITTTNTKYLRQLVYAHGNSSVTAANWLNFYNNENNQTNITVDASAYYTYDSQGYLTKVKDGLTSYEVVYTYSNGKVSKVQEYGLNSELGQTIGFTYYSGGYTEARTSGTDDIYNNTDDIITRYVFDNQGRTITSYSTDSQRKNIYSASSGEYTTDNTLANNNLKVSTATGSTSANYLLNGSFEASDSVLTYWNTSGTVNVYPFSSNGLGKNLAELSVSANTTSSIYQYVYLRAGDYTLSLDVDTWNSNDITIKLVAQSLSNTSRVFEQELSYNKYYASGKVAFDMFSFTANSISNGGELFKISVSVTDKSSTEANTCVSVDNIMLSKSIGAQPYNMVYCGDFETTSVNSTGASLHAPTNFWKMTSESSTSSVSIVTDPAPFYKALRLTGDVDGTQVAEQILYSASASALESGNGRTTEPQFLKISGFARATSVMHNPNSVFALKLSVKYYQNNTPVEQYYRFCEDNNGWQYINGSFIIPKHVIVEEIKISCEYSGNIGFAYFDDISVVFDSEGETTQYEYDSEGRTQYAISGNEVIYYSYEDDGDLKDKITRRSITRYTYDDCHRLLTENYYTFSGYLAYKSATYDSLISTLGELTLEMSSSYVYNEYGLLTQSTVTSPEEDKPFITISSYNVTEESKIFGSLNSTLDTLGKITKYFYDENNGRLLANIQPDNTGTCYTYDFIGNLILVQPATYASSVWNATTNSAHVSYDYNNLNQVETIRTNGTEYTFSYNSFGNKDAVEIGDTTIISQTYNSYNGKINSVVYANGTTISYAYDQLGRIKTLTYDNNGIESVYEYEYDSNGNLNKYIDNVLGRTTVYKYDDSGRMTNFIEYDMETMENLFAAGYIYDDHSRLSGILYSQDYAYETSCYDSLAYYQWYFYTENDLIYKYYINNPSSASSELYTILPFYDGHNRISSKTITLNANSGSCTNSIAYGFKSTARTDSVLITQYTSQINSGTIKTYNYTYDSANANITKITSADGTIQNQYTYDALGRLLREDNLNAGRTYVYTYDSDGNILTKTTYGFTTAIGTPTTTMYSRYVYTYGNSSWGDQLTAYRGNSISYDAVGNPTSYYNGNRIYFAWTNGNNLASAKKNSVTTSYTYNDSGIRTSKNVGGIEHTYTLDGSIILSEAYDGKLFLYYYDEKGAPIGMAYRKNSFEADVFEYYLFEKNFQGDITGIYREDGTQVVWYGYDAWGNSISGSYLPNYDDIYEANPFRYRGYYYDNETGFYYCGSRYYDPVIGRFINPDSTNTLMNTPMAYTDKNLYAYCDNNPVMRVDNGGEFWDTVFDVISLCASVVDVVKNPDDPWAWVGLAADVVSLAVPFATGGGLIVDAVTKADDVVDLVKSVDKVSDAADNVYDGVKAMSKVDIPDCFVAGTMVATEDGHKSIETIEVGDYVWATDEETGETSLKQVVNTFINETTAVTHVTINGEVITSTQTHPYYVVGRGWTLAGSLQAGDILVMLNGEKVVLELVQHEILETPVTTYNFEVADFHTYYVSEATVLVHNRCILDDIVEGITDVPQPQYTQKVLNQMSNITDTDHAFPIVIDELINAGQRSITYGGDGLKYLKIEIPGSINGDNGIFEYIMDATGRCNHRYFRRFK